MNAALPNGIAPPITIDAEFKAIIPPLTREERAGLENNILSNGCRVPLDVWRETLVDGHNRYEICEQHGIDFKTKPIEFTDRDAAIIWIIDNQLDRRNIVPFTRCTLVHEREKHLPGRDKGGQPKNANAGKTNFHNCENSNQPKTNRVTENNNKGQVILYVGANVESFAEEFSQYGAVYVKHA